MPMRGAAKARQRVLAHRARWRAVDRRSLPLSGRSSPAMVISSVDLPEPEAPTRPTASPRPIVRLTLAQYMHPGRALAEAQVDVAQFDRRCPPS